MTEEGNVLLKLTVKWNDTRCWSCTDSSFALNCFAMAWMGTFYTVPLILGDCTESYYFSGKIIRETKRTQSKGQLLIHSTPETRLPRSFSTLVLSGSHLWNKWAPCHLTSGCDGAWVVSTLGKTGASQHHHGIQHRQQLYLAGKPSNA